MWPSLGFTCTSRSDPIGIIHIAREETMNIAEVVCLWFNSHLNKKRPVQHAFQTDMSQ